MKNYLLPKQEYFMKSSSTSVNCIN